MISFTFLLWVIITLVYVATLLLTAGPNNGLNEYVFLGPDLGTLHKWGALDAYEIRYNYQIWRLFTSLILSIGFSYYCISSGCLLVIGFIVETKRMSPYRMAILFFGSGILGNLFSICVESEVSVGPMTGIMAWTSALISGIIVNWKLLAGAGMIRICLIFMCVMLFVVLLCLSISYDADYDFRQISLTAEAGGFMAGFGMGMMLMPHALQRDNKFVKLVRKIGFAITVVYMAILFPVFYCSVEPRATRWVGA